MSVSTDFAQIEKMQQFLSFVDLFSNPEKLHATVNEMRDLSSALTVKQGIVSTLEEARAYHDKLMREVDAARAKLVEEETALENQRMKAALEFSDQARRIQERETEFEMTKSTVQRAAVSLQEKADALLKREEALDAREAALQKREQDVTRREQEFDERAARLRAAVGG